MLTPKHKMLLILAAGATTAVLAAKRTPKNRPVALTASLATAATMFMAARGLAASGEACLLIESAASGHRREADLMAIAYKANDEMHENNLVAFAAILATLVAQHRGIPAPIRLALTASAVAAAGFASEDNSSAATHARAFHATTK